MMGRLPGPQVSDAALKDLARRACRERAELGLPRPTIEEFRAMAWPAFVSVDRMCRVVRELRDSGEIPDARQGAARWEITDRAVEQAIRQAATEQRARRAAPPGREPSEWEQMVAEHMARERRIHRPRKEEMPCRPASDR